MTYITGLTRGGNEWQPVFILELNQANCIGCGRCYKACPRDVFELVERVGMQSQDDDEDDYYDDDEDDFSDDTSMVMSLKNSLDCIGCEACYRMCPKKCMSHQPQPLPA